MGTFCSWALPARELTGDEQAALTVWLREHGIEPGSVAAGCVAVMAGKDGSELHVTEFVTGEDGGPVVDYAANRVVTRPRIVPLATEPPFPDDKKQSPA
ncbi:hypothetical protein E1264_11760 [Actinomadura sp. KC216]|uniref:hypothetical protein n=1 Tax=Actinomadura sp. KC216 TaxID=2530370 RepID=UPI00104AB9D5|nr:hypothetical protein [Actinomadura sp. KC216]TDB88351.1 hypothetical protein E1264_11760 [Actinomadura sp. KC216]